MSEDEIRHQLDEARALLRECGDFLLIREGQIHEVALGYAEAGSETGRQRAVEAAKIPLALRAKITAALNIKPAAPSGEDSHD